MSKFERIAQPDIKKYYETNVNLTTSYMHKDKPTKQNI